MESISRSQKPRNWTRKRINRELRLVGVCQADIVRELKRSQSLVSGVIDGTETSLPVATAVAAKLGRTAREIWPRIYGKPARAKSTGGPTTEPRSPGSTV